MSEITIEIAQIRVSDEPADVLVTHALGSCIAVTAHDPIRQIAGMIHFMLPTSNVAPEKAALAPGMFADTGVPLLFERLYELGCSKSHLIVKVIGGAKLHEDGGTFEVGRRNAAALNEMFSQVGIRVTARDVGGVRSRTVRLHVGSGQVLVSSLGMETEL